MTALLEKLCAEVASETITVTYGSGQWSGVASEPMSVAFEGTSVGDANVTLSASFAGVGRLELRSEPRRDMVIGIVTNRELRLLSRPWQLCWSSCSLREENCSRSTDVSVAIVGATGGAAPQGALSRREG